MSDLAHAPTAPVPIDQLLPLLANVRQTSPDRWLALCPTANHEHGDRHPSLGIRVCDDGVVLLRCYSMGCDARLIAESVGLDLRDLFPQRVVDCIRVRDGELTAWTGSGKPRSDRLPYRDALQILRLESRVTAIAAGHVASGVSLSPDDVARGADSGDSDRRCRRSDRSARPMKDIETLALVRLDEVGRDHSNGDSLPISEDELALKFAAKHQETLRHVPAWNCWLRWDGARWVTKCCRFSIAPCGLPRRARYPPRQSDAQRKSAQRASSTPRQRTNGVCAGAARGQ